MVHNLVYPFTENQIRALKLGDKIYISGEINFSAGLPTYQRMIEFVENKDDLPIDLINSALFHLGSNSRKINNSHKVLYVNPTTSARFNPYMPTLIKELNLRLVGGKGGLSSESVEAMREAGCVYLSFLGGGAPIYTQAMVGEPSIYWEDLVPHYRLTRISVENFGPMVVAIDAHGNSLYQEIENCLAKNKQEICKAFKKTKK